MMRLSSDAHISTKVGNTKLDSYKVMVLLYNYIIFVLNLGHGTGAGNQGPKRNYTCNFSKPPKSEQYRYILKNNDENRGANLGHTKKHNSLSQSRRTP